MLAKVELLYRILITDKNGRLVRRTRWKKSKSYVIAFLQHLDLTFSHEYNVLGLTIGIIDTGGVSRNIRADGSIYQTIMAMFAPDNEASYGIVVGTGTTTPTNSDYKLATQIAHGVGAGQLDYGGHSRTAAGVVGANVDYIMSRTFYNGSGATITVNEIGFYCKTYSGPAALAYCFCLGRDVLPAGVDVLNTQTLTVQYTLRTTV